MNKQKGLNRGQIRRGEYYDSVTLMRAAKEMGSLPGILDAAVVMGSQQNLSILKASALYSEEFAKAQDSDLLVSLRGENEKSILDAFKKLDEIFRNLKKPNSSRDSSKARSFDGAMELLPQANLALISVAGKYAAQEAHRALDRGLHVMIFSDNVSLEQEIEIKKKAAQKGLLVMGPDCGTAIINGSPLGFANQVRRGSIGIVAASGTGAQEVSVLCSNAGEGISQLIGTGGRDVKAEVGGIMFMAGLKALLEDPATRVIVLVSKPPHASVMEKIAVQLQGNTKQVVSVFLGADRKQIGNLGYSARTLEEAVTLAVALSEKTDPALALKSLRTEQAKIRSRAKDIAMKLRPNQKYIRGLFSGGTFCSEAQIIARDEDLQDVFSNVPYPPYRKLGNSLNFEKNTFVDLGEDEFTVGKPHPMIDDELRNRLISRESANPEVAVLLLDLVLGFGSNLQPVKNLLPAISGYKKTPVVVSVTGTESDPQKKQEVIQVLEEAGVIVMPSNAAAALLAVRIAIENLKRVGS